MDGLMFWYAQKALFHFKKKILIVFHVVIIQCHDLYWHLLHIWLWWMMIEFSNTHTHTHTHTHSRYVQIRLKCLSVFPQRPAEDRSVSRRTPEENTDQRSVNEAQRWRPVAHRICVATRWHRHSLRCLTSVQSVKEQAVVSHFHFTHTHTSICCF